MTGPARVVGILSYSLYLWHFPVFHVVEEHMGSVPALGRVAIGWGATFACPA